MASTMFKKRKLMIEAAIIGMLMTWILSFGANFIDKDIKGSGFIFVLSLICTFVSALLIPFLEPIANYRGFLTVLSALFTCITITIFLNHQIPLLYLFFQISLIIFVQHWYIHVFRI